MTSSGPNYAGTSANDTGASWTNPGNAVGQTTYTNNGTGGAQDDNGKSSPGYLNLTNYGFSIPAGSTINGIRVEAAVNSPAEGNSSFITNCQLIIGGSKAGSDLGTGGGLSFGSSATLWGLTPSVAQINAANFGVSIKGTLTDNADQAWLNGARITVTYTPGSSSTGLEKQECELTAGMVDMGM